MSVSGLVVDIVDGLIEFHRDAEGNPTIIERDARGGLPDMVIVPSAVWAKNWSRLVSLAELRKLEQMS